MPDIIEKLDDSVIQHGKDNNRIYLMKLGKSDVRCTIEALEDIVRENGYTKVVAKVPTSRAGEFLASGYSSEAYIPGFYKGVEDASFMCKYFNEERSVPKDKQIVAKVLEEARRKSGEGAASQLDPGFTCSIGAKSDAEEISQVYRTVFQSYPFPIHDKDYILDTMRDNVVYFCIREKDRIVSVSSSEMDVPSLNVEMTDFATLPEFRGRSFAAFLLSKMEHEMRARGVRTAYSIARAVSYGMNITFAKLNYRYGGTLLNNTDICGRLESMNIWYKSL